MTDQECGVSRARLAAATRTESVIFAKLWDPIQIAGTRVGIVAGVDALADDTGTRENNFVPRYAEWSAESVAAMSRSGAGLLR